LLLLLDILLVNVLDNYLHYKHIDKIKQLENFTDAVNHFVFAMTIHLSGLYHHPTLFWFSV